LTILGGAGGGIIPLTMRERGRREREREIYYDRLPVQLKECSVTTV